MKTIYNHANANDHNTSLYFVRKDLDFAKQPIWSTQRMTAPLHVEVGPT